ncbi:Peroxidase 7-like protein [Drosera capensis]
MIVEAMGSGSYFSASCLLVVILQLAAISAAFGQDLVFGYYDISCPNFEEIVSTTVKQWVQKDQTLAPALLRLHFHDCAVRGCDASILLDFPGSERTAHTVSCADILTAAARDATSLLNGPFWANQYGRKDGTLSYAHETSLIPAGYENVTQLIEFFQSKGLSLLDLVVLSGAHTVGRCTCGSLYERLYYFNGTKKPDPSIAPKYLDYLERKCSRPYEYADFDATTPHLFDSVYYENLQRNTGE